MRNRILSVDDDELIGKLIAEVLGRDFDVTTADRGEDALRLAFENGPFDLILLDVSMPGMDGFELCRLLKSDPRTDNVPIVFLSADLTSEKQREGFELGAVDYVTKPISAPVLIARVRLHIELSKARDQLHAQNVFLEQKIEDRNFELGEKETQLKIALQNNAQILPIKFRSLTTKLLSLFLPLVFLSSFALFAILESAHVTRSLETNRNTLTRMAAVEAEALSKALWEFDHDALVARLKNMRLNPDFRTAQITDSDGDVIAETTSAAATEEGVRIFDDLTTKEPIVYVVDGQTMGVGTLSVTFHAGAIEVELKDRLILDLIILAILCIVLGGITTMATRQVIGSPVARLRQSIERLKTLKVREPIVWDSVDEIGQLVQTFNELQEAQEAAESEIRAYQINLEKLVEERTNELSAKGSQLRSALDNMPGGMIMVDDELTIVLANRHYEELFEFPNGLLDAGNTLKDMFRYQAERGDYGEGRVEDFVKQLPELFNDGADHVYERHLHDGRILEVRIGPIAGGGSVAVATDISEQKLAVQEADLQRAQLNDILDNVQMGVVLFNENRELVAWNPRFPGTINIDPKVLKPGVLLDDLAKLVVKKGAYGDGDSDELARQRADALWAGEHITEVTYGDDRFHISHSNRTPDGRLVIAYTEITERKRAEEEITRAHTLITDSIDYASHIQRSALPDKDRLGKVLVEHFVIWEPCEQVGGDIYWHRPWDGGDLIMLADCTGHGVPGAFMTLIASGALDRALTETPPGDCAALIQRMHQLVQQALGQDRDEGFADDGLELGVCFLPQNGGALRYAGANISLYIQENGAVRELRGDRKEIGYRRLPQDAEFTNHEIEPEVGMSFYMTTDGLPTQVGEATRLPFSKRGFLRLLESLGDVPMSAKPDEIMAALHTHMGSRPQRDDISLVGFKTRTGKSMGGHDAQA